MLTVFGLGFVGLTTALGFAEMGHVVYGVESDVLRYAQMGSGQTPFLEPGLDSALGRHLDTNFKLTDDIRSAIADSEAVFYCVGTPC